MSTELLDLLRLRDGRRVGSPEEWRRRRAEIQEALLPEEYGLLPPAPAGVRAEELISHGVERLGGATHSQYRLHVSDTPPFWFHLDLLTPPGPGPYPVVIDGDACWAPVADGIAAEVLGRGYALAQWSRTEIVPDLRGPRDVGLYRVFPGTEFGALAAWAWGYHRCVDFLSALDRIDPTKIVVVGHSRGGKTSLLAGATDERVAVTSANDSGCGGAGCYRLQGPTSETLADIVRVFPYWFSPRLARFVGREGELPFDQHFLKAMVAPRALLTTEARGDLWANPSGTRATHVAAREAYRLLGVESRLGIWYRDGGHDHGLVDWLALLDFADWQLFGKPPPRSFAAEDA
jgi:hypothetical protein